MRIDRGSATPLYQQIAALIRGRIVDGELSVGDRLPPHRLLATQLGVSLITINKALSGLVSEGVLYSRVGYGTSVAVRPAARPVDGPVIDTTSVRDAAGPTLGFVLRDLNSAYFSTVANACETHAHLNGYGLLVLSSGNVAEREDGQIRRLLSAGVHGLIVVSMTRATYRMSDPLLDLKAKRFPFVMVSYATNDDAPFVGSDYAGSGRQVAEHLLALGRRRLGYVTDRFGSLSGEARSRGYRQAAAEFGVPVSDAMVFEYPFEGEWNDYRSGREVGLHIANRGERPDALFVYNDLGALGLIEGLTAAGLRVPDDIAVVGFDGIAMGTQAPVPITTVRQPVDQIGQHAVAAVLAQIAGTPWRFPDLLATDLMIRTSSGAPLRQRTPESDVVSGGTNGTARPLQTLAEYGLRGEPVQPP